MSFPNIVWSSKLPDGSQLTTPLLVSTKPDSVFVGTNGCLYEVSLATGTVINVNNLDGRGNSEVRLAFTPATPDVILAGITGHLLGVNVNELSHTFWDISLPGCGYGLFVDVLVSDMLRYAASNGFVYSITLASNVVEKTARLSGMGNNEVRLGMGIDYTRLLITGSRTLLVGTHGYVLALDVSTLDKLWETSLPRCGYNTVSVLGGDDVAYAGCNGHVYQLRLSDGALLYQNDLAGTGEAEVRLAFSGDKTLLLVGTNGYGIALSASDISQTRYSKSLAPMGRGYSVTEVVPWQATSAIFANEGNLYVRDSDGNKLAGDTVQGFGEGFGEGETRLSIDDKSNLVVGLNGYVARLGNGPLPVGDGPSQAPEPLPSKSPKPQVEADNTFEVVEEYERDPAKYVAKPPALHDEVPA